MHTVYVPMFYSQPEVYANHAFHDRREWVLFQYSANAFSLEAYFPNTSNTGSETAAAVVKSLSGPAQGE
jgi:hypothetical protein